MKYCIGTLFLLIIIMVVFRVFRDGFRREVVYVPHGGITQNPKFQFFF